MLLIGGTVFAGTNRNKQNNTAKTTTPSSTTSSDNDFADGELAWTSYSGALRKITKTWVGANAKDEAERIHPTQKPIYLYKWILDRFAREGFKVLDTHLGSGSIAVACWDMGFDLTAYEIDKEYFDAACKRLENHKKQLTLW